MKSFNWLLKNTAIGILLTLLLVCITLPALAQEKQKTVIATGVAAVQGDNISGARQNAIQDALRQALEQGVGMAMDATTILQDDDLMEKIYSNTQGYITTYEIIKERKEQNGLYRVKIQAAVKTGELRATLVKLGIIKAIMDYPRIMILPHPQNIDSSASKAAETVLIKNFTDKRFDVVDPGKSKQLHGELKELFKVDDIKNVAAKVGLQHHAEIVILYELKTSTSEFDGIMENTPVDLRTQAIVTTTAQILSAQGKSLIGVGKTREMARMEGARQVTEKVCQPLMHTIVSWWADYTANGPPYVITLKTPTKADRLVISFQQAIESIPGVVSLTERSSGGGITEMMVKYRGNTTQLKREIISKLDGYNNFEKLHTVSSKGRFLVFSVL